MNDPVNKPVLLAGCRNAWCTSALPRGRFALINIVKTDERVKASKSDTGFCGMTLIRAGDSYSTFHRIGLRGSLKRKTIRHGAKKTHSIQVEDYAMYLDLPWICNLRMVDGAEWRGNGLAVCGIFRLGSIVMSIQLVPSASWMDLDDAGFTVCSLFRTHRYMWTDIQNFGIIIIKHNRMVAFNFVPDFDKSKIGRSISHGLVGYEAALPDSYGLKAENWLN